MRKLIVQIEDDPPHRVSIFIDDQIVAWQPFEPTTLAPWESKEAAAAWAEETSKKYNLQD